MDAKCPNCERKAQVNEELSKIKCNFCGYEDTFEEYMKKMEERLSGIVSNYQDKNTFNV
ncbi:MAG: zinc-domain-containing protein [Nitrososphaerales archaeon]